jgi:hypothetical protein
MYYTSLSTPWKRTVARHGNLATQTIIGVKVRAERRRRRSKVAEEALHHWLYATARRLRIPGLVLADATGLLIASNLAGDTPEELAALAPLLLRKDDRGSTAAERHAVPMGILAIRHEGARLLLLAVAKEPDRRQRGLLAAAHGVQRILRELVRV